MPKLSQILSSIGSEIETELEAAWSYMKPQFTALGQTVLAQVEQAAETFVSSGGNYTEALASIVSQLPADLVSLEHIVASYLSLMISSAQAKATAATAPSPTAP